MMNVAEVPNKIRSAISIESMNIMKDETFLSTLPKNGELRNVFGQGWPECDPTVTQWSGYFDIPGKKSDKHYFYWAFGPRNQNVNAPVVLWMNGGPGCSSELGLFGELGPCQLDKHANIINNTYSWNSEAYLIFIDQPAGVGFSYADEEEYDHNETEVAEDMFHFLQAFFDAHEELRHNPFFITGESYAGHYAPAIAHRVMTGNKKNEGHPLNLTGVAIGNGWTDPYYHFGSYAHFAHDYCEERLGQSCVSRESFHKMLLFTPVCMSFIKSCDDINDGSKREAHECRMADEWCSLLFDEYADTGLNPYDIRMNCSEEECYDFSPMVEFLNKQDVQTSLGVNNITWQECNDDVGYLFSYDINKNFNYTIPDLLQNDIRVMIYAGDMDFICNYLGNEEWVMRLDWKGKRDMFRASTIPFHFLKDHANYAGTVRAVKTSKTPFHFSFVRIFDAGHMVPMDQPAAAYTMIHNFINNVPFN